LISDYDPNRDAQPEARVEPRESLAQKTRFARFAVTAIAAVEVFFSLWRAFRNSRSVPTFLAESSSDREPLNAPAIHVGSPLQPEFGSSDPIPPRTLDRNLDADPLMNPRRRTFWPTLLALLSSLVALAASVAFLVAYWTNSGNSLLGSSLAVACGGWGATLVIWGRMLTVQREAIAPREPLLPPEPERAAAAEAFASGADDICRRSVLRWAGYCMAGMFTAMAASLLRSLGVPSYSSLNSHIWRRGQRLMTIDGNPVTVQSIQPGNTLTVFPEDKIGDERSQTVLIRVDQSLLQLPQDRQNWAPSGILAYSRVCTHAGCTVGLYERSSYLLMCPCHQSTFNVLRSALPNGGPAARALPQLPLYADSDGTLRAGGGFSAPPGPGFWGIE
jgi:ubiquinol-cytochrome c reductase iron-sulfur subunit